MSIIIGADFVPTNSNFELFINADIHVLLGKDLISVLRATDYKIFNLEVPLTDVELKIDKNGPSLIAPSSAINAYKKIGVNLLTLANNHILDQGVKGLENTIKVIEKNNINFVGAGADKTEAKKPYILNFNGKKVGIYSCVENEFSVADGDNPGANGFDVFNSFDDVESLKRICDYVIVLYHGGKEHYRYPSPNLQKICRRFCSVGADLVLTQHSHCIGCKEEFDKGTIVYGQGNFLFDYCEEECWQTGLLVKINDDFTIEYIPIVKKQNLVRLSNEKEAEEILNSFEKRSQEILEEGFIEKNFKTLADQCLDDYLLSVHRYKSKFCLRVVNKIFKGKIQKIYLKHKFKKKDLYALLNYINCETLNEVFVQGLKNKVKRG